MRILLDILSGLIALLAAATLSQFGVELNMPRTSDREIERIQPCPPETASSVTVKAPPAC